MKSKEIISTKLIQDAKQIIETARENAVRSVDFCRVQMYWNLGRRIFEEEQHGKKRADYGAYIVKSLAEKLEAEYGSGFSKRQLEFCCQFFITYPIANTVCSQLNWSQYKLMKTKSKKHEKVKLPKGFKLVDDFLSKEEIEALENDTTMRDPMVITGGHESETLEESIARISRAIAEAKEEKKMYSIRLKVKTVESIKRKAAAAGIPYQTYVNVLLDNAASA